MSHVLKAAVVVALSAVLTVFGGAAYAGGCHHHPKPPPTRHVTVSASFTDQVCLIPSGGSPAFQPAETSHSATPGVWWSSTGGTGPGETFTWTAHAFHKRGVVIDGSSTFSHTFPATPTAQSCVPPKVKHAWFKVKTFSGCTPARRYVEVTAKHNVKVTKHHNKARTTWRIKGVATHGATFADGSTVKVKVRHPHRPRLCGHPHSS
jgi:hypothetical protein